MAAQKVIDKRKNRKILPSLEVVDVVLVQWILVHYQYQHNSEVLHTFTTNKSYGFLLNVKPNNLVFLTPYNTDFMILQ